MHLAQQNSKGATPSSHATALGDEWQTPHRGKRKGFRDNGSPDVTPPKDGAKRPDKGTQAPQGSRFSPLSST